MNNIDNSTPRSRPRIGGFTLVELMVAMVITTIILGILLQATGVAVDGWRTNRDKVRAARQAKVALDQISKDFESFQVRSGNKFEWLYARVDDAIGSGVVSGGSAAQIAFFTGATDRYNGQLGVDGVDKGGDVSAVGYRLVYKDPIKNDTGDFAVFALYRNLINPDLAFEELLAQEELLEAGGGGGPFKRHMDEAGDVSNFVSENIYDLTVTFLIEYEKVVGRGNVVTAHKRLSVIDTSSDQAASELRIKGNGIFVEPELSNAEAIKAGRLVSVDIGITVITDGAMNLIQDGGLSGDELAEAIAKNSYRYTRTVVLPGF